MDRRGKLLVNLALADAKSSTSRVFTNTTGVQTETESIISTFDAEVQTAFLTRTIGVQTDIEITTSSIDAEVQTAFLTRTIGVQTDIESTTSSIDAEVQTECLTIGLQTENENGASTILPDILQEETEQPHYTSLTTVPTTEVESAHSSDESSKGPKKRRKQFCKFCKTEQSNLPRHLRNKHSSEDEVKAILETMSTNKVSRILLDKLRVEGYVEKGEGTSTVVRKGAKHYAKCSSCGALYSRKNLYRHFKRCSGKPAPINLRTIISSTELIENKVEEEVKMCEPLKRIVLPGIRDEQIIESVMNDKQIINFGNNQCLRFGNEVELQKNLIRSRLRILAKVKIMMSHVDNSIINIIDIFNPEKWDNFIEVVKELAHLNEVSIKRKSPNVVHHIGQLLSNLAKDIRSAINVKSQEDINLRRRIKCWLEMYGRHYANTIGCQATKLSREKKWKKKKFLPLAKDLLLFNNYIRTQIETSVEKLKKSFDGRAWEDLSKGCMLWLLSYNRKRVGELTNITLEDFNAKAPVRQGTDIFLSLTPAERVVSDGYYHVDIRGKWTRPVSLLIKTWIAEAINILVSFRGVAGVFKNNQHLFANRGMTFYNASVVLTEAAYACGAASPEDITSTAMRQHMATMAQAMNLTDNDFRVLCGYLGHTTETHLGHYRRPSDVLHAARLSKLLSAFDNGTINLYRGKSLDDIDVTETFIQDNVPPSVEPETVTAPSLSRENDFAVPSTSSVFEQLTPPKKRNKRGDITSDSESAPELPQTPSPAKRKRRVIKWSTPEKHAMRRHFQKNIDTGVLPTFPECHQVKLKETSLARRKVAVMKAWVNNQVKRNEIERKRLLN